jgi:hypothetical protein
MSPLYTASLPINTPATTNRYSERRGILAVGNAPSVPSQGWLEISG